MDAPEFTFETYVTYPARAVKDIDGSLRIEWTVPVHSELQAHMVDQSRTTIPVKARCWKGFTWGQLGSGADIRITATLTTGPRGGQYLHCTRADILKGVPRHGEKLPKSLRKAMKALKEQKKESKQTTKSGQLAIPYVNP